MGEEMIRMRQTDEFLEAESPRPVAKSRITRYLRFDDDLDLILGELSHDRRLREVIAEVSGIRIVRQDPWECLVSFIISRNCNIPMIRRTLDSLCRKFGKKVAWDEHVDYSFPAPGVISQAEPSELIKCGLRYGRRQALELKKMAEFVSEGMMDFSSLRRTPYEEAKSALMSFDHGVGNKVADCVLLFSLEKLEAFPVDVWVARAVAQLYEKYLGSELVDRIKRERRLAPKDYRCISDFGRQRFGRYAGYAQEYLYHWIRLRQGVCRLG